MTLRMERRESLDHHDLLYWPPMESQTFCLQAWAELNISCIGLGLVLHCSLFLAS
jgi:hypothetical protein